MDIFTTSTNSQIFLNYTLALCAVVLVAAIVWFLYRLSQTLDQVDDTLVEAEAIMSDVQETVEEINTVRKTLKSGAFGVVTTLASVIGNATNSIEKK